MSESTMSEPSAAGDTSVRPFRVSVVEQDVAGLRRRIAATRWPEKETIDRGNHFAAWQEPELFTTEVRAAFRTLRDQGGSS
jgi:hypothetical protein